MIRAFLNRVFGPAIFPLITSMYSLAALVIVPILIIAVVFEFAGKGADRPDEADAAGASQGRVTSNRSYLTFIWKNFNFTPTIRSRSAV